VTDAEVDALASEIFASVRALDSPRDAASALTMARYKLLEATFGPHEQNDAIEAVEGECAVLKKFIAERIN